MTDAIAPEAITTVTVPDEPSPLIAIPVCVPFVPPVPAALIFTMFIAPSTAAELTVEFVATAIKSVDKKFVCCEADKVYIYFHLYPSPVVKIDVDVPVGSTVELALLLLSKHLYTLNVLEIT